ncbi:hypothetical protein B4110_3298 [Parageobacillus toebii]|jgi:hypothetical protein|uniref:Uncharacterized protein n=1 Tax=Parageobacillus toebii TaxID=153151 RepID=A0A150N8E5_9BACL|nr:hypothetical protein B4110_3298 [Parageobacillus toebii]
MIACVSVHCNPKLLNKHIILVTGEEQTIDLPRSDVLKYYFANAWF